MAMSQLHPFVVYGCADGSLIVSNMADFLNRKKKRHNQPLYHVDLIDGNTLRFAEAPPIAGAPRVTKLQIRTDPACTPIAMAWSPFAETSTWLATSIQYGIVRLEEASAQCFGDRIPSMRSQDVSPAAFVSVHTAPFSSLQTTIPRDYPIEQYLTKEVISTDNDGEEKPKIKRPSVPGQKKGRPKKYASYEGELHPETGLPLPPKPVYDYGDRYKNRPYNKRKKQK